MPVQQGISQEVYCHRYIYDSEAWHQTILAGLQTVLDITGRGKATVLKCKFGDIESHYVKITVDGNVIINDRRLARYADSPGNYGTYDFNYSFKVEHRNIGGINMVEIVVSYCVN